MNVVVLSNSYPRGLDQGGIFIAKQVESLRTLKVTIITVVRKGLEPWGYLPFWTRSILLLFSKEYDLVHAHYGFHSAILPAIFKKKPLVTTFHGSDALVEPSRNRMYYYLQRFVVRRSDHLIAVSSQIKDVLIKRLGADPNKISVISCGVETTLFAPGSKAEARSKLGMNEAEKVVLFVGRVTHSKGIDVVCECAHRMPDVTFHVLGEGTWEPRTDNIKLMGIRPNEQIPAWLNAADVLMLPSRSEGTPVVLLEALSCGVPVVASAVGGILDLVKHGKTGYLVDPEDVNAFESRLRELLADPHMRLEMGRKGRTDAMENYDGLRIAERIEQVYDRVLAAPQYKGILAH